MITFTLFKNCELLVNSFSTEIVTDKLQVCFKDRNDEIVSDEYTAVLVKENGAEIYYKLKNGKCEIPAEKMLGKTKICVFNGLESHAGNELLCKKFNGGYTINKCVANCNEQVVFYMKSYDKLLDDVKEIKKKLASLESRVEDLEGYDL